MSLLGNCLYILISWLGLPHKDDVWQPSVYRQSRSTSRLHRWVCNEGEPTWAKVGTVLPNDIMRRDFSWRPDFTPAVHLISLEGLGLFCCYCFVFVFACKLYISGCLEMPWVPLSWDMGWQGGGGYCNPTLHSMVSLSLNLVICFPSHSRFYAPGLGSSLEFCYIAQASLYCCIPACVFWAAVTYLFSICQQNFIFSSHLPEIYWKLFQE